MNLIAIANETLKVTKEKSYRIGERVITFPEMDYDSVIVVTPEKGQVLLKENLAEYDRGRMCAIEVVNADSFQAARRLEHPLVMNFANAHNPGGGFLLGATAQEEALCRCSTLYASIHSKTASEMYRYNNTHPHPVESDYMLISPKVLVFRDEKCLFLEKPFLTSVVTLPAPNRRGAAILASGSLIQETMLRRIRIMLCAVARQGYQNLVLGAWGCGAFGNRPEDVASFFKQVLVQEEYGKYFERICFAIYGREDGRNITAFRECFDTV